MSRTRHTYSRLLLLLCAAYPSAGGASGAPERRQLEVRVAGSPATALGRVHRIFADRQWPLEGQSTNLAVAEVPPARQDLGGGTGIRVLVRAVALPLGGDSSRLVLTGYMAVPTGDGTSAETIAVTSSHHPVYGRANRQGWAAIERLAAALAPAQ